MLGIMQSRISSRFRSETGSFEDAKESYKVELNSGGGGGGGGGRGVEDAPMQVTTFQATVISAHHVPWPSPIAALQSAILVTASSSTI